MSWGEALGSSVLEGALNWLGAMAFIDPLHHRPGYTLRAVLALPAFMLAALAFYPLWQVPLSLTRSALTGIVIMMVVYSCARTRWSGAVYCAMLVLVCTQTVHELWMALQGLALQGHTLPWTRYWWVELLFSAAVYLFVWRFLARYAAHGGSYDVGVGQMFISTLLAVLFVILFDLLQQGVSVVTWNENIVLPAVLGQINCLVILCLQNELFNKSAIQRELDTMNLLYEKQKQQYAKARRGVELINRRCHALKVELARLRAEGAPPDSHAEEAMQTLNAMIRTGSEVLNTVLTEKALLCEEYGITLNCVVDGESLSFVEVTDLYTLFAEALDNAMEEVQRFAEPERRLVEVRACRRQGFVVVQVSNPVVQPLSLVDGLPGNSGQKQNRGYGLKTIRRILRRYDGQVSSDVQDGVFTLRILIPQP